MAGQTLAVIVSLGLATITSGAFLGGNPKQKLSSEVQTPGFGGIMNSLTSFNSQGLNDNEIEDMEVAVETLITKGDDATTRQAVKQLENFIVDVLIPNRKKRQQADQDALDLQLKKLANCHLDRRGRFDPTLGEKISIAEDHKDAYSDSMAEYGTCVQVLETKALLRDAHCHGVKQAANVCHCDDKMLKLFGARNKDCSDAPEIAASDRKCCDAFYEHEKQGAKCGNANGEAVYAQKQHKIIMSKLCKAYESCYDTELSAYTSVEDRVKDAEKHRSWEKVYRLQCLFSTFKDTKVSPAEVKSCKEKTYDVDGIDFPALPQKDTCQVEVVA